MPTERSLNGWDMVRKSQVAAAAVIRELHAEMDRGAPHTRRTTQTQVDVVEVASDAAWLVPEPVA
jgi:hypothetical protein